LEDDLRLRVPPRSAELFMLRSWAVVLGLCPASDLGRESSQLDKFLEVLDRSAW
jgi:hypothetical protein